MNQKTNSVTFQFSKVTASSSLAMLVLITLGACTIAPNVGGDEVGIVQGTSRSVSGFMDKVGKSIDSVVSTKRSTPRLNDLQTGIYQKSSEAIGEEKDVYEKRITHGLVAIPLFTDFANKVLEKLKVASGVQHIPGQVIIAANEQLEAGATADGNIFISNGYIRELKSEDELAALLSHELAHVLLRHHDSSSISRIAKQASSLVQIGMSVKNALDKSTTGTAGNVLTPTQKTALNRIELLIRFNDIALQPAWGRRQENEADQLGMDLLIKARYSYENGMLPWLEDVAKWDANRAKEKALMAQRKQDILKSLIQNGKLDDSLKQGVEFALKNIVENISLGHEDGDKRLEYIDVYYTSAYKEQVPQIPPTTKSLVELKKLSAIKSIMDGYRDVFLARKLIAEEQKYEEAMRILAPLVDRKTALSNEALPNQLMFEAYRGKGRLTEAEKYLVRSYQSSNPVWDVFDSASAYFREKGNLPQVLEVGKTAYKRFSGAPSVYPRLIAMYRANGLTQAAESITSECLLKQSDKRDQCLEAAKVSKVW